MGNMGEIPVAEDLQKGRAELHPAKVEDDMRVDAAAGKDEEAAKAANAEREANRALQTARWGAIDDLIGKKANELAAAMASGNQAEEEAIRASLKTLEAQKDKAADRLMGGVEQNTDAMVQ